MVHLLRDAPLLEKIPLVGLYIAEAHADDEWPVSSTRYSIDGSPICVNQPRTMAERAELAARFATEYGWTWPMLIDSIPSRHPAPPCLGTRLCSWPMRAYLFHRNQLVLSSSPLGADVGIGEFFEEVTVWIDAGL